MTKKTSSLKSRNNLHCASSKKGLVPYHLFHVLTDYFVLDTTVYRFYKIDKLTWLFLKKMLHSNINDVYHSFLLSKKYDAKLLKQVYSEVKKIARSGLLDTCTTYIDLPDTKERLRCACIDGQISDLQLTLSEDCNLACKYCYCRQNKKEGSSCARKLMPENIAKSALELLAKQKVNPVAVTMFGGEPLLNKPVIDFIMAYTTRLSEETKKEFNYIITTNATLLDDKTIDYIVNYNFGLMVSLDGPQELHDSQCPTKSGEGSFQAAAENIKKLMQRRTVGVRATMIHPMPDLKQLIDFFMDFGFSNMAIAATTNRKDAPSECDFTPDDMRSLIKQEEKLLPWMLGYLKKGETPPYFIYDRWYNTIRNGSINTQNLLFNCGAARAAVGVDTQGFLYPCVKFSGMKNWKIGDIEHGLDYDKCKKIWWSFIQCIAPKCGKCWAYPICGGPCLWECARNDGSFQFDNKYCAFTKKSIERAAYLCFHVEAENERTTQTHNNCTLK